MNILITNTGRKTKLVEYFKNHFNKVVTTDSSMLSPGLYFGDSYYLVPEVDSTDYFDSIKYICKKENIDGVISLADSGVEILSSKKSEFEENGLKVISCEKEVCEICFDKWKMHCFLKENGFKIANSYIDFQKFEDDFNCGKIKFPVFVKPTRGNASIGAYKVENFNILKIIFNSTEDLMIQEYIGGQELGIDVYGDLVSKEVVSIFAKEKIEMRAGATDKAVSIKDDKLFSIIKDFSEKLGVLGPMDIDVFRIKGEYYISDVNPRFGAGYLLAYECGEKFPEMILENLKGNSVSFKIGQYKENIYMMNYEEIKIINR